LEIYKKEYIHTTIVHITCHFTATLSSHLFAK